MAIVVTGATGGFGSLLVAALLARGVEPGEIVATGRDVDRLESHAARGVRVLRADYDAPATLDAAFAGADTVVLVSHPAPGSRMAQHTNAVRAVQRAGVGRVLYTSIVRADHRDTVLTADHRATEALLTESGVPFVFLRNTLYTGFAVDKVVEAQRTNEILARWGDGRIASATRDDLAEGAAAVVLDPSIANTALELTGDTAWDGRDFAAAASEVLGHPVLYAPRTADERAIDLHQAGVPDDAARFVIAFEGDVEAGAFAAVSPTLSGLLGRPTTPLVEGLRAALPPGVLSA